MKIKIIKSELANLYLFISNLSQWNELVCIPKRKREWIKQIGKLKDEEKNLLEEFAKILQESNDNLEPIFLFSEPKMVWLLLTKNIGKNKTRQIRLIFDFFKVKFKEIWSKDKIKINRIATAFEKKNSEIKKNLKIISGICGFKQERANDEIQVKLLLSAANECQGWSFGDSVVLECSGWDFKKIDYLLNNIFLHECFHIILKKNKNLFSKFSEIIKNNRGLVKRFDFEIWGPKIIFEEILISSFLPEGYLGEVILGLDIRKIAKQKIKDKKIDNLEKLRYFCALRNYDTAKEYIDKEKVLDKSYFLKIIDCFKEFKK
ncbi:MAG: hypothetical protein ABIC36_00735 [bacterium]